MLHLLWSLDTLRTYSRRRLESSVTVEVQRNVTAMVGRYEKTVITNLECEFISEIVKRADCKMLLDINNIYVSSRNHGFSPQEFLNHIDPNCVQQFHLAGHEDCGDYVIDTHDHDVPDPVWDLYADALKRFGPVSAMIERDDNIPEFSELQAEMNHAKEIAQTFHPQAA